MALNPDKNILTNNLPLDVILCILCMYSAVQLKMGTFVLLGVQYCICKLSLCSKIFDVLVVKKVGRDKKKRRVGRFLSRPVK